MSKELIILGIRGIPAEHGGFETFAEQLSLYLARGDWKVTVYCQVEGRGKKSTTIWRGIRRIHIPVSTPGALGSMVFDIKSIIHSMSQSGIILVLGYNTASFNFLNRMRGQKIIINMDGIEWKREKWGKFAKLWFWCNERLACVIANKQVADHPCIADHIGSICTLSKIRMIPYGAEQIDSADRQVLRRLGLEEDGYAILIARPEPENSILELVQAFSSKRRYAKLVVLGTYEPKSNAYHRSVIDAASEEVKFLGAIYDFSSITALRLYCRAYLHGHKVGGTNPSLVEALGAGNAILAQDNQFNRWVAGEGAVYFTNVESASLALDDLFQDDSLIDSLKRESRRIHKERFRLDDILAQYETLLLETL